MMKCSDCLYLSKPQPHGPLLYAVTCNRAMWVENGKQVFHSQGMVSLNRGPVNQYGETCTVGKVQTGTCPQCGGDGRQDKHFDAHFTNRCSRCNGYGFLSEVS